MKHWLPFILLLLTASAFAHAPESRFVFPSSSLRYHDAAWNLAWRTNNGAARFFSVNSRNELTFGPDTSYFYHDPNGNLTHSNNVSGQPALTYSYDDENQLVEMVYSAGSGSESLQAGAFTEEPLEALTLAPLAPLTLEELESSTLEQMSSETTWRTVLAYDGLGRLRVRQEYVWTGSVWSLSAEHRYVYDGLRVIQVRQGNNTPYVSYTRGHDVSGSLAGAGGIGGLLARTHWYSGGNWYTHNYYHADGGGNVTYLVNSSQGLAASYRYDPYGNVISSGGGYAEANVYRYSSKEHHAASGLYYYGYRWYEPQLQRWLNRDPIGEVGGINLYRFVRNSPLNRIDTDGREDFLLFDLQTDFNSEEFRRGSAAALGVLGPAAAEMGASMTPVIGELMDIGVLAGSDSKWWEKGLAGVSLGVNAVTGGLLPNAGGFLRSGKRLCEAAAKTTPLKYHYTTAPESSFQKGLWRDSSVTDKLYTDPLRASQELGIPVPNKVIPIQDVGQFVPNKPPVVQPLFRFQGGGTDFINPQPVLPSQLFPAQPIGPR